MTRGAAAATLAAVVMLSPIAPTTGGSGGAVASGGVVVVDDGSTGAAAARDAATRFLEMYVDPDGRVVRRDQGGDTVGEGQAYALWLAAGIGDEPRFRVIWEWTVDHLVNADGLLAVRWDGEIVDAMPATDADLVAAAALALAGERFDDAELSETASRLAARILRLEADGSLLVAGPWAHASGTINPSYFVLPAMSQLWRNGDHAWADVAATSRRVLAELTAVSPHLAPDWAVVHDGAPAPAASPRGESARFGYEASRVLIHLAADCDDASRRLAAAAWPFLASEADEAAGSIAVAYGLDGTPLTDGEHPATVAAAAAAADAAGDTEAAAHLLDRAARLDEAHPTYYGAALVALARVLLDTDLLTSCGLR